MNSTYNEMMTRIAKATGKKIMFLNKVDQGRWTVIFHSYEGEYPRATVTETAIGLEIKYLNVIAN